jgi:2-C-methyl-D-erythritol 4-phosphate cytidylyltransferase
MPLKGARDRFRGHRLRVAPENAGGRIALVEGERSNIKITFADDLERAALSWRGAS